MRAIKNRTYYNFLQVMKVILAKGYEREEAAKIVRNIFDEFEACPAGLSVWARADMVLSAAEYRQTYGK